jgi:hypothetical protein
MKKSFILFCFVLLAGSAFAQSPQRFNYQAVARTAQGAVLPNQNVRVRASIIDSTLNGRTLYSEVHNVATNQLGLFNLAIGGGTTSVGTMNSINWTRSDKFLRIELDPAGGSNFTLSGTTQLLSVPFALNANTSNMANSANRAVLADSARAARTAVTAITATTASRATFADSSRISRTAILAANATRATVADSARIARTAYTALNVHWQREQAKVSAGPLERIFTIGELGAFDIQQRATTSISTMLPDGGGHTGLEFRQKDPLKYVYMDFTSGEGDYKARLAYNLYEPESFSITSVRGAAMIISKEAKIGMNRTPNYIGNPNYTADNNVTLQVRGDILTTGGAGASRGRILFDNSNHQIMRDVNNNLIFNTASSFNTPNIILLDGARAADGVATNTGNVGINTSNPRSKLQVTNGDVYIETASRGVIMKSPDGNCWRMTVTNSGQPQFTQIACPQ